MSDNDPAALVCLDGPRFAALARGVVKPPEGGDAPDLLKKLGAQQLAALIDETLTP